MASLLEQIVAELGASGEKKAPIKALRKKLGNGKGKDAFRAAVEELCASNPHEIKMHKNSVKLVSKKRKKDDGAADAEAAEVGNGSNKSGKKASKKGDKKRKASESAEASDSTSTATTSATSTAPPQAKKSKKAAREGTGAAESSSAETQKWRDDNNVQVSEDVQPSFAFDDPRLPSRVVQACCEGFERPTPIQSQCWPVLMADRDIVGLAETGSGKTLAFTLPGLHRVLEAWKSKDSRASKAKQCPLCLTVAPTRELAQQSADVAQAAGAKLGVNVVCIYGGVPKDQQRATLRRGVSFVIATPGRLRDLIEEGSIDLSLVQYLVLDEADRMLDMGFLPDMRAIVAATHPTSRQTAMLSATWPVAIQKLAQEFLSAPVKVTVGTAHEEATANIRIKQIVEVVDERERDGKLKQLLSKYHSSRKNRILVFALYKKEAARLETMLQRQGWACAAVHGDKAQRDREAAVSAFKKGTSPLLIATDVAARGLDIPDVEVVINYSFPLTIEDYVHRIGRTGRAGKSGTAHTFFHNGDKAHSGELVNVLRAAGQAVPDELTKFGTHTKKKESKMYGAFFKDVDLSKKATKITFDD